MTKSAVPKAVFGKMLSLAFNPPREIMRLPFTATQPQPAECFVSLLLRPVVCPGSPRLHAAENHGDSFLRAGQSGQQP